MTRTAPTTREDVIADGYSRGWGFIRLNGKVPVDRGWQHGDRLPLDDILAHPGNVGLRTGSGLVVVDIDEGADLTGLELPETVEVETGSGGRHLYYSHTGPLRNSAGRLAPHVDIRADGGQVVFPGSIHPDTGRHYRFIRAPWERDLAPLPEWIVERLTAPKVPASLPAGAAAPAASNGRTSPYVRAAMLLETNAVRSAANGTRNDTLNKAAFSLGQFVGSGALERGLAESELHAAAAAVGLGDVEAAATIKSGLDAGEREPREIPERPATAGRIETIGADPRAGARPLTDLGNAERFAEQHQGKALYDVRCGAWRVWDGARWALDRTGRIMRMAQATARSILGEAQRAGDSKVAEALAKHALKSESRDKLKAMIDLAQCLMAIEPDIWDADPWALNVANGTLDLRTGELRPHDPNDHITKLAPVAYDQNSRHAMFDKVLIEALPDESTRRFFQKVMGYALCGEKGEKILAFVYGPTDTAKSTICDALRAMLGDYAMTVEPEVFEPKTFNSRGAASPEIADLAGVRFVLTAETNEGRKMDVAQIKRMTGGENLRARHLYGRPFEFRPQYLIVLMSNHRPIVSDADDALWNRLRVVPFEQVVPEGKKDPAIKRLLENDPEARTAMLAWLVAGCLAWQGEGLAVPEAVKKATGQYREAMDPLTDFLAECCIFSPDLEVSAKALRMAYEDWARDAGQRVTLSPNRFADRLRAHGCVDERISMGPEKGRKKWLGIGLNGDSGGNSGEVASLAQNTEKTSVSGQGANASEAGEPTSYKTPMKQLRENSLQESASLTSLASLEQPSCAESVEELTDDALPF